MLETEIEVIYLQTKKKKKNAKECSYHQKLEKAKSDSPLLYMFRMDYGPANTLILDL